MNCTNVKSHPSSWAGRLCIQTEVATADSPLYSSGQGGQSTPGRRQRERGLSHHPPQGSLVPESPPVPPISSAGADSAPRPVSAPLPGSGLRPRHPHSPAVMFLFKPKVTFLELDGVLLSCRRKQAVTGGAQQQWLRHPQPPGDPQLVCRSPSQPRPAPPAPPPGKKAEQTLANLPEPNPQVRGQGSLLTAHKDSGSLCLGALKL